MAFVHSTLIEHLIPKIKHGSIDLIKRLEVIEHNEQYISYLIKQSDYIIKHFLKSNKKRVQLINALKNELKKVDTDIKKQGISAVLRDDAKLTKLLKEFWYTEAMFTTACQHLVTHIDTLRSINRDTERDEKITRDKFEEYIYQLEHTPHELKTKRDSEKPTAPIRGLRDKEYQETEEGPPKEIKKFFG